MKYFNRHVFGLGLCAMALVALAAGVDLGAWAAANPEVAAGLGAMAFMGDTQQFNPTEIKNALDKLGEDFRKASDSVKEVADKALTEASRGVKMAEGEKQRVDELLTTMNTVKGQLTEVEQKLAAHGSGGAGGQREKSMGELLVENPKWKSFVDGGARGSVSLSFDAKVVNTTAASVLIRPRYETDIVQLPRRRLTIRDLLPVVPINTSSVDYPKQLARTNNAAPVAEAAAKPYSDYTWTNATVPVRTIAHLAKLTRQAMDDAPRLQGEVDSEMRYGLGLVEEAQILSGDGTGQNLSGLITQATAFVAPITIASPTRIDNLRLAMLQAAIALYPPDGIVLSLIDWAGIQLTKTTDGAYLLANPTAGEIAPRLWGLPVVDTPAMTADKFLVGNFAAGATLYDRMGVEVLISTENVDDFEKNLATMRAEERIALAVKRPGSFIYGDFGLLP